MATGSDDSGKIQAPAERPTGQPASTAPRSVWARIRDHKVAQWTLAYAAAAYTLLHGVEMVSSTLDWPHVVGRVVTLLLFLGVPMAATLAWYHGHRAQHRVSGPELAILTVLLIIAGSVLWFVGRPNRDRAPQQSAASTPAMASGVTVAASAPPEKSIAVLPFADMSEKHDQEYFSDGLSEELINLLTKVPELRVPARTSSFYFKGKPTTIAEIAKMLGVAHVLEGSVRKDGDTVRVTVQLIRAADGYHLWSETYDRRVGELFKTQDDIASAVVRILRLHLLSSAIPASGAGEHVDAHNLLLQARFFSRRRDEGDEERSDDCIRRAVALDPNYALAWAYLSPRYGGDPRARQAAERALQLDPALPDARLAMGLWYERREWNWAAADKEFKRALELAPNYAVALQASSILAMKLGRFEEAIALAQRGTERDPISPDAFEQLGHALRHAEQWSEAEAAFRRALEISPRNPYARAYLGFVLSNQGHSQAALNEMRQVSDEAVRLWGLSIIYSAIGRRADSDRALAELTQKYADHEAGMISSAHAYRNERDAAFDWLDRAYAQRDGALSWLKVSQFWRKNLAGDPRYEQWLRKLNLAS